MPPASLAGAYAQYKHDTSTIAAWLASTARACGCDPTLLQPPKGTPSLAQPPAKYVPRKKHAKRAAASATASASGPQRYIIAIKAFVPLAECIAAFESPAVRIPQSFSTALDRVIAVRSAFGAHLRSTAQRHETADAKHSYFVGILQEVRHVLACRMATAAKTSDNKADDIIQVTSLFGILRMYEPSQESLDTPDIEPASKNDDIYEAENVATLHEALVAYAMMVNDLNQIRSRIQWIWENYADGFFDLAVAAIATNTAIDLARNITESAASVFKDQEGGLWGIANEFHVLVCLQKGIELDEIMVSGSDNFNYDLYDIADDTFLVAHRLLESFKDVIDPQSIPLYKEGTFGYYDPKADRSRMSGMQKSMEDQAILMEFFTELMTVVQVVKDDYPVEDQFLRGMKDLYRTNTISFSLVFAAQIFLDIQHTLRDRATMGFSSFTTQTSIMANDLNNHLEFHENLKIDNWPKSNDVMLRRLVEKFDWFAQDPVYTAKVDVYRKCGLTPEASMKPHRILEYSPVLCGLALYHFRAEYYNLGIAVANAWGSIMYTEHLYNALQSENLLTQPWRDMDVVAGAIGPGKFFVGDPPRNPDDYFQRFCLQVGVSASVFANPKQRRQNSSISSRSGPKGLKTGIPVSGMFMDRYLRNRSSLDWTAEMVAQVVAGSAFEQGVDNENGILFFDKMEPARVKDLKNRRDNKKRRGPKEASPEPQELIRMLVWALQSETLEFAMPYLHFHRSCWGILRILKQACEPMLTKKYTPAYMEHESELPFIVGYILMAASRIGGRDEQLLQKAAEVFEGIISAGTGSTLIDKVLKEHTGIDVVFEDS